ALCGQQCGGVAYIDVFDDANFHADYQPAWVFADGLANDTKAMAEATTHEVGHNFGLVHDGNASQSYDAGHGAWAPIMGVAYDRPIGQWSKGDYAGANNQEDDLAIIASAGAPLRADESAALPTGTAYITSRTDTDTYQLDSCLGPVTLTAKPAPTSPNLDIKLSLLDATGAIVTSDDPPSAATSFDVATGMGAAISTTALGGTYYVQVDGVGNGTPVSGYDDYGSIGAYTLAVAGSCIPLTTTPTAPTSFAAVVSESARTVTLSWAAPSSDGGSPVIGYEVLRDSSLLTATTAGTTSQLVTGLVRGTTYTFSVRALNAAGPGPAATTRVKVPALKPGAPAIGRAAKGAKGGTTTATATWRPPADDGGAPVLKYRVVAYRLNAGGAVAGSVKSNLLAPTARRLKMKLAAGRWRFAVQARNTVGPGPLSAKSNAVKAR
ncbi:MAG: Metallo-peptidase family Reprolysin-like, partial [Nocardioides sp.]|nr:Metallo-peptidase family Reprolysin-like [Nocardioides sp.]